MSETPPQFSVHYRNKIDDGDVEYREYAQQRTRETYNKLMATPRTGGIAFYAWREHGEIKVTSGKPTEGSVYGYAEGSSYFTPLFSIIAGWRSADILSFQEEQNARCVENEIRLRNVRECWNLKARAVADLLEQE